MSIIQQLEDLKEWSKDSTRYERRLAFRNQSMPGGMGTEAGTIPIEWDELSDREREYYRTGPWSTREDYRKGQLVQPGPGRQGYAGQKWVTHQGQKYLVITEESHPHKGKIRYLSRTKGIEYLKDIDELIKRRKLYDRRTDIGKFTLKEAKEFRSKIPKTEVGYISLIKDKRRGIYSIQAGYGGQGQTSFIATEDNIIKAQEHVEGLYKKKYPNALLDSEFVELRLNDENIHLTNEEFANKLKNKTTKQGKKFNTANVGHANLRTGIIDQVNPMHRKKYSIKEIKDIIRRSSGGQKFINANIKNETALKREAKRLLVNERASQNIAGFPVSDTNPSKLWRNFNEAASGGNRIKIKGTFNGKDISNPANWPKTKDGLTDWRARGSDDVPFYQKIKFQDTEAPNKAIFSWEKGENIVGGNLKNQIDSAFGDGFFDKSTKAYGEQALDRRTMIRTKDGLKSISEILVEKLIIAEAKAKGTVPTKEYIAQKKKRYALKDVHHNRGIANDPYSTESTLRSANRALSQYEKAYAEGKLTPEEFRDGIKKISKEHGGIRREVEGVMVGKKATQESILEKIAERTGLNKRTHNQILKAYQANGIGKNCPIKKAEGGRIGFAEAGVVDDNCMRNAINEHKRKLADGNEAAIKKQLKINQTKSLKNILNVGSRGLRGLTSIIGGWGGAAIEAAVEAGFYGYGLQQGESHEQARENLFLPKILAKYAPDLWEKFGGKPFKTGVWEGPEKLIEEELLAGNEQAQAYTQGIKALEDEYANASKIDFELGILNNQWRPGSEEQIEAKKQELTDSYDRIEELQLNVKEGTPIHDAYVAAQEKQKALRDERAQEHWGDSPAYKGSKQRQWQDEFLDYRGADRKYRKDQPYAFKGGLEGSITGPNQFIDWDAYADYGWDKPEQKWKDLYDTGGWDLMDKIGIAGGVANMAGGGIAGIRRPWAIPPESGPDPQGLASLNNYATKRTG